jgi:hypothetical protein
MSINPTTEQQVRTGFSRAGGWILGIAWLGLVLWGILEAFGSEANFSEGRHPSRLLGYFLLGLAAAVFVATANRWKRIFPGIMVSATLGVLLELWHGHAVHNPSVFIPRWIALVQLVVIAGVTALSFTFKKRDLGIVDRMALLTFAASLFIGGEEATRQKLPVGLIVGGLCIMGAWTYNLLVGRPNRRAAH